LSIYSSVLCYCHLADDLSTYKASLQSCKWATTSRFLVVNVECSLLLMKDLDVGGTGQ